MTISGDQFETITKDIRVTSSSQNVNVSVAIEEQVTIVVTASSGANISGATVVLGNQTKTTGADGTATFQIAHGTYTLSVTASGYATYTDANFAVNFSQTKRITMNR